MDTVVSVHKQADFLLKHGPEQVAATTSWLTGYSPMVDDFANCSVLTVTHRGNNNKKNKNKEQKFVLQTQ